MKQKPGFAMNRRNILTYFFKIIFALFFFNSNVSGQVTYTNPILAGFYPDQGIRWVGYDYYLVKSSFSYFRGLPIFNSVDLVNWKKIGNAMNRNLQLKLDQANISGGLFAPAIRYHNGTFYIMCTIVSAGGNFIITSKDPKGPWSDPVLTLEVNGIDPSLFFDNNGKAYTTYNSIPPDNESLYSGHRTIQNIEYDVQQKTVGDNKIIINGGTNISKHLKRIEGLNMYKINGWYFV